MPPAALTFRSLVPSLVSVVVIIFGGKFHAVESDGVVEGHVAPIHPPADCQAIFFRFRCDAKSFPFADAPPSPSRVRRPVGVGGVTNYDPQNPRRLGLGGQPVQRIEPQPKCAVEIRRLALRSAPGKLVSQKSNFLGKSESQ